MNRRRMFIAAGVVVVAALVVWGYTRRQAIEAAIPAWLDTVQPPDNVAAQLPTVSEAESFAANRARPMVACCQPYTAGNRVRRTYPRNLAESPDSIVRPFFRVEGGV